MAQERLQKILASAGIASRRAAEALIAKGEVRLNGRVVTELGAKADAQNDRIEVSGKRIVQEKPVFYVLNKPREVVTTLKDPEGRATIADLLKRIPERVFPVGRLDFHTSGVLLLTNDGELAQALLHPTRGVPKAYVVKVKGLVPLPKLEALRNGVVLDDGQKTKPSQLFVVREEKANTWLQITITEGRNRQIHRMCEAVNLRLMRLSRVAFADITADGLRPGDYRELTVKELSRLDRDFRNPATRQRVDQARIRKYLDAGFDMDEPAVTRAPRGPRRGNISTQRATEQETREALIAQRKQFGSRFNKKRGAATSSTAATDATSSTATTSRTAQTDPRQGGKRGGKRGGKQLGKRVGKQLGKQAGKQLGKQVDKQAGKQLGKRVDKRADKRVDKRVDTQRSRAPKKTTHKKR